MRLGARLLRLFLALACVGMGAYLWFLSHIPEGGLREPAKVDGLVVLTGGAARLDEAIALLAQGRAGRLLISGVNTGVSPAVLRTQLKVPDDLFACCIDLGYRARDTVGNAAETAAWVGEHGIRTLMVVTADYHMPRSLAELHRAMPEVVLFPHPVFPSGGNRTELPPGGLPGEFVKYVMVLARNRMAGIGPMPQWQGNAT